jgi:hypothetical protein
MNIKFNKKITEYIQEGWSIGQQWALFGGIVAGGMVLVGVLFFLRKLCKLI